MVYFWASKPKFNLMYNFSIQILRFTFISSARVEFKLVPLIRFSGLAQNHRNLTESERSFWSLVRFSWLWAEFWTKISKSGGAHGWFLFFPFILFSIHQLSVKQVLRADSEEKVIKNSDFGGWWQVGEGTLPFLRPCPSRVTLPPWDGIFHHFAPRGWEDDSPPSLTCFRNFIQVQVMGWVPATLPNSSTDSPARTLWSSGNWMIWGGMAGREQMTKWATRKEPPTDWPHSVLLSTLVCSSLTFQSLQGNPKDSGHCSGMSELMDLLAFFISLLWFFRSGPHNFHGIILHLPIAVEFASHPKFLNLPPNSFID